MSEPIDLDGLVRELDGSVIYDGTVAVYVLGAHVDDSGVWIQVALEPDQHDIVVHLLHGATGADALRAMESLLRADIELPHVIEVPPGKSTF